MPNTGRGRSAGSGRPTSCGSCSCASSSPGLLRISFASWCEPPSLGTPPKVRPAAPRAPCSSLELRAALAGPRREVNAAAPKAASRGKTGRPEVTALLERARERNPQVRFTYAWPFAAQEVAGFLGSHIHRFLEG